MFGKQSSSMHRIGQYIFTLQPCSKHGVSWDVLIDDPQGNITCIKMVKGRIPHIIEESIQEMIHYLFQDRLSPHGMGTNVPY